MTSLERDMKREDFNLAGVHLVRASAGTGKTHSIQSLFLRLIIEKQLTVQQILVVTFTEAATKELRDRLRQVLQYAANYLDGKPPSGEREAHEFDERIGPLVALVDREAARHAVRAALLDFDLAAIHTIHGFCNRALKRFAFETGQSFDTDFEAGTHTAIDSLCEDWYRKHLYDADTGLVAFVGAGGFSLQALMDLARKCVAKPDAHVRPDGVPLEGLAARCKSLLNAGRPSLAAFLARTDPASGEYEGAVKAARAFRDKVEQCHRAIEDGNTMAAGLLAIEAFELHDAKQDRWRSRAPWTMPRDIVALADAAAAFEALIKGKRKDGYGWDNGKLRHAKVDAGAMDKAVAAIARAYDRARPEIARLLDGPDQCPLAETNAAAAIVETLKAMPDLLLRPATADEPDAHAKRLAALGALPALAVPLTKAANDLAGDGALLPTLAGLRRLARAVLAGAAADVRAAYERGKAARQCMSYDDLLLNLRAALTDPERGRALGRALREGYKAALIDEFQDTDPVQYGIFKAIFIDDSAPPCFLVGDPKQAIYRFRSGDIEAYRSATSRIPENAIHELDTNHRAEERLVAAINQLFGDRRRGDDAFTFRQAAIPYPGTLAARGKPANESLLSGGIPDPAPFKLWYYTGNGGDTPGKDSPFAHRVYADTAAEIDRLLHEPATTIGGKPIRPRQVAVLVLTHDEADFIAEELAARGIPAVRQGVRHVFETDEADDLAILLAAMAEPRNGSRVRAALATQRLLGIPYEDIAALNAGLRRPLPADWQQAATGPEEAAPAATAAGFAMEDWIGFFAALHAIWRRRDFVTAFNTLAARSNLRSRLARQPRGERLLTNVLHLVELTHRAIAAGRLSIEGTLAWFARQLDPQAREEGDDYELRLETDNEAVRILTVFKSKGLQFPIVFVPTLWRRLARPGRGVGVEYHDDNGALVLDLEGESQAGRAIRENQEEDIRLAYVACTRAIHRTYLVWSDIEADPESSALAWLLGAGTLADDVRARSGDGGAVAIERRSWRDGGGPQPAGGLAGTIQIQSPSPQPSPLKGEGVVERFGTHAASPTSDSMRGISGASSPLGGEDRGEGYSDRCLNRSGSEPVQPDSLSARPVPEVDKTHGHTSFTGLMPHASPRAADAAEGYDFDAGDVPTATGDEALRPDSSIFAFPAGAKTGECWHRILELLPFDADDGLIRETVAEQLELFGLTRNRATTVRAEREAMTCGMVKQVLAARLDPGIRGVSGFSLRDVRTGARQHELAFDFPAAPCSPGQGPWRTTAIRDVLRGHWRDLPEYRPFLDRLENWDREIPGGFMSGFIDLVFRHGDGSRFYIVDWKSNRRGGQAGDFDGDGLREEIAVHGYFLQYLIYTVALHQYLRSRLAGYDYDRHFGGVFYLFLRGVDGTPGRGIYHDRPARSLIDGLSSVLGDFA